MKKALIPLDSDELILKHCTEIERIKDLGYTKFRFLEKQAKDLAKSIQTDQKQHWMVIEDRLQELGKIKSARNVALKFNVEQNIIFEYDQEDKDASRFKEFLKRILTDD